MPVIYTAMKKILTLLLLFYAGFTFGQETVQRSNSLTSFITETFGVLKADKNIREGEYTAKTSDQVLATGNYHNGKRVGNWVFFDKTGKAVQSYNYDTDELKFNDTTDVKSAEYYFVDSLKTGDKVIYPVKIGGMFYGCAPFLYNELDLSRTIIREMGGPDEVTCRHIFTINDKGDLVKHEVLAIANGTSKLYELNDSRFNDEFKRFTPAMINRHPVASKMIVTSILNFSKVVSRSYIR